VIGKKLTAGIQKSPVIIKTKGNHFRAPSFSIIMRVGVKSTAINRHHVMPINGFQVPSSKGNKMIFYGLFP
jgi:hypothetical protein